MSDIPDTELDQKPNPACRCGVALIDGRCARCEAQPSRCGCYVTDAEHNPYPSSPMPPMPDTTTNLPSWIDPDRIGTHWDGCERSHPACAWLDATRVAQARIERIIDTVYESWLPRHPCDDKTQWHVQNYMSDLRHAIRGDHA